MNPYRIDAIQVQIRDHLNVAFNLWMQLQAETGAVVSNQAELAEFRFRWLNLPIGQVFTPQDLTT